MKKIQGARPQKPIVHAPAGGNIHVILPQPPMVHITAGSGLVLEHTGSSSSGVTFSRVVRVSGLAPARTTTWGKGKAEKTNRR